MLFTPRLRTDSYRTLSYYDIWHRHIEDEQARDRILAALRSGALVGWVKIDGDPHFWEVPADHWTDSGFMEGCPGETLRCWPDSAVPIKFHDRPLLFFLDEVTAWEASASATPAPEVAAVDPEAWAEDAVDREVTITDARRDALKHLGAGAPPQDRCRSLLRTAREKRGIVTKQGRPFGSKSFAKSRVKT